MKTQDLTYSDGPLSLRGFLAYDETRQGKRPGVVVVHEAWGLGEHAMERAKMLAGLGYVALAADMYGDRRVAPTLPAAMELMGDMRDNANKWRARANAAVKALAAQPQVDPQKLFAIGFCFGGSTVLELARGGTDLLGVVSFHGALETKAPAKAGAVKASVLVCTGSEDTMIGTAPREAFEKEMREAGADWQLLLYGKTVHSFTNPSADGSIMPIIKYNAQTDKRSWLAMRNFFDERLEAKK